MAWTTLSCFLTVFAFHLAASSVIIYTNPAEIKIGLTDMLTVNCSYTSQSPLETVLSLILSRDINGTDDKLELASLSSYTGQAVSQVPQIDLVAEGNMQAAGGPYLAVTFRQFRDIQTGIYRCQVNGVDRDGHVFERQGYTRVMGTYPDYDLMVNIIRNLRNKTGEMASIAYNVDKINGGLNSSFTGSTYANQQMLQTLTELSSNTTLLASATSQDAQRLLLDLQNAEKNAAKKTDAMQLTLSGETSTLTSETLRLIQRTDALSSSYTLWKEDLHKSVSDLQTADSAMKARLDATQRDLDDFSRRLDFVEKSNSIFHQRVDGIKYDLFDRSFVFENKEFLLTYHSYRDQSIAEATCAIYNGYLAEINDAATYEAVKEFLSNETAPTYVVIGGTDEVTEGHWVFQHSQTSAFFNAWGTNQPAASTANNCRFLDRRYSWTMYVTNCYDNTGKYRFLCEVPL